MVLVLGGAPRPEAQYPIRDEAGVFIGRLDLYYEQERVGIEFDGATHRDSMPEDLRRQNRLLNAGVHLLRFTAEDVLANPSAVIAQVRLALHRRRG